LSGPPKTPTNVLIMRGSPLAGKRTDEPRPDPRRPRCPVWLPKQAHVIWSWIVPQLEAMGVLGRCDKYALARYCQYVLRWQEAEAKNDIDTSLKVAAYLSRLDREFGLTPSARAGLAIETVNPRENRGKGVERHFDTA